MVANPVLLAEVLSPSTEAYDRGDKAAHCRRAGNNDWLLSKFTALTDLIELTSLAIPLPVAALYENVPLEPGPRR